MESFMIICGGFALGSTALGGSTVKLCTSCTPNLIVTKVEEHNNIGTNVESYLHLK